MIQCDLKKMLYLKRLSFFRAYNGIHLVYKHMFSFPSLSVELCCFILKVVVFLLALFPVVLLVPEVMLLMWTLKISVARNIGKLK